MLQDGLMEAHCWVWTTKYIFFLFVAPKAFCQWCDCVSIVRVAGTGTRLLSKELAQGSPLSQERSCVLLEKLLGGVQEPQALDWVVVSLHPSLSALNTLHLKLLMELVSYHMRSCTATQTWSQVCALMGINAAESFWHKVIAKEKKHRPKETFSPLFTSYCSEGMSGCLLGVPLAHLLTGFMQSTN